MRTGLNIEFESRQGPQYYASRRERQANNSVDSEIGSALFLSHRVLKTYGIFTQ